MTVFKQYRIACLATLLSILLFLKINVVFVEYIVIAVVFLAFSFLSYPFFGKNRTLSTLFVCIAIPNLIVYLGFKYLDGFFPVGDVMDITYAIYGALLAIILLYVLTGKKDKEKKVENFFDFRERELIELEKRLQDSNIIGIDAAWGDGKSFLLQLFAQKQDEKKEDEKIHIISISVMSSTIETIEAYIISEISMFLEENKVFSYSSPKIKKFFLQPLLRGWSSFFDEKNSYSELFGFLVRDIKNLGKKVALSFEDLERIRDDKIILKVFNISEKIDFECKKIGCDCIKIIYQYEKKELIDVLKIERKPNYLEKYIPVELRLTPIPFIDVIKKFIEKNHYRNIIENDFISILSGTHLAEIHNDDPDWDDDDEFDKPSQKLDLFPYNLRKVELFLKEVDSVLDDGVLNNSKGIVIVFFIMKYFYPSLFLQIEFGQSLCSTMILILNENGEKKELKMQEYKRRYMVELRRFRTKKRDLSRQCEEEERGLSNLSDDDLKKEKRRIEQKYQEENQKIRQEYRSSPFSWENLKMNNYNHLLILEYLGYDIQNAIQENLTIEKKEKNDAIDEIVWKLKYMGASGCTKSEGLIRELEEVIVSNVNFELKKKRYVEILSEVNKLENFQEENCSKEEILFILTKIYVPDSVKWKEIIDFYIQCRPSKFIDDDIFPVFERFKISTKKILLSALEAFASLDVNVSFFDASPYLAFLRDYLKQIKLFGYYSKQDPNEDCFWGFSSVKKKRKKLRHALSKIKEEVKETVSQNVKVESIVKECDLIIKFIDKNIELVDAPVRQKEDNNSEEKDQKYKDYLVLNSEKELNERIEEKYKKGEVSLEDVRNIRELFEKGIVS